MHRIALLPLVLATAILACSLSGSDEPDPASSADSVQSADSGSNSPAEQLADDQTGGQSSAGGPEFLDLDDPLTYTEPQELIDSYRIALSFAFEGTGADGTPVKGTVTAEGERVLDPLAMSMTFDGLDTAGLSGELPFSFSLIGNTYHFSAPLFGCASIPSGEFDDPFSTLVDMGGFLMGQAMRMRPDEVINGIPVHGFSLDASNLAPDELEIAQFDSGTACIAQDGGYLVRLEMTGRGTSEMLSGSPETEGEISYELNYFDFNQAFDITPPEDCDQATDELEYPVTDDAYQLSTTFGITSYKSDLPFEEVIQFYRDEMAADGWTLSEEFVTGPIALLSFSSDTGSVQITLTLNEGPGTVDVGIIALG